MDKKFKDIEIGTNFTWGIRSVPATKIAPLTYILFMNNGEIHHYTGQLEKVFKNYSEVELTVEWRAIG